MNSQWQLHFGHSAIKYCINRMMQRRMKSEKSSDRHFSRERWGCQTPGSQTVQAPDWYFHHDSYQLRLDVWCIESEIDGIRKQAWAWRDGA